MTPNSVAAPPDDTGGPPFLLLGDGEAMAFSFLIKRA
jgi:hypothetical protein